ncbi:hypothetical protein PIB30_083885 [Stylosanthes scabra]|uniref:Aminotransferase-like plant mobile domain-containing protein n=1 Tax=Stylosanthes scabra TaxID=79078 RepID=A0ABU6YRX5_9FABA|nr:hypothetical protein [Stylosanthes scabra]
MWRGRAAHRLPLDLHPNLRPSRSYLEWYFQWANLVLVASGDEQDQLVQHVPLDLPVFDLPTPQLHQPEDGHLPEAPRRIDDTTSSESASHGDLRGSMRPYMSDTSSDAPGDDPPQGRSRRVRRPPACGTGGCLEAPLLGEAGTVVGTASSRP